MHTLHWIAVEANDKDEAVFNATSHLEAAMGDGENYISWYDWFVVGGGRWNTTEDEEGIMGSYITKTNMIISYKEDPNGFRAKIDDCIQQRMVDYKNYLAEVKESNVLDKLENYGGTMTYDHHFYALNALLRFQMGEWSHDSWFYDFINDSSNATHILSKLDKNEGDNIYLVPIDFHF
jgi:hypothetical protein